MAALVCPWTSSSRTLRSRGDSLASGSAVSQGHQTLLNSVAEIALDAAALGVDRLQNRGPAGGQLADALLEQLSLRGAETLSCQP
ncbi:hypothetical protein [Streptomyces xanthochromogenes]|uniref:hypothetical protein n=1 Tax=Streptomyces xanthochromogenes TaxID=67384 RepID=UPI0016754A06